MASDFETRSGSFDSEFTFHLSQARHNVEEEASRSGTCIDRVGQAFELDTLPLKFADKIHEVLYAAPEPVQSPDDEGISFAESFLSFGQTWTVCPASSNFVLEDLLAASLVKCFDLQFEEYP